MILSSVASPLRSVPRADTTDEPAHQPPLYADGGRSNPAGSGTAGLNWESSGPFTHRSTRSAAKGGGKPLFRSDSR
jgi:hypothetical protein